MQIYLHLSAAVLNLTFTTGAFCGPAGPENNGTVASLNRETVALSQQLAPATLESVERPRIAIALGQSKPKYSTMPVDNWLQTGNNTATSLKVAESKDTTSPTTVFKISRCTSDREQIHATYRVIEGSVPSHVDLSDGPVARALLGKAERIVWRDCPALGCSLCRNKNKPDLANIVVKLFQNGKLVVRARSYYRNANQTGKPFWQEYMNHAEHQRRQEEMMAEQQRRLAMQRQTQQRQRAEQERKRIELAKRKETKRAQNEAKFGKDIFDISKEFQRNNARFQYNNKNKNIRFSGRFENAILLPQEKVEELKKQMGRKFDKALMLSVRSGRGRSYYYEGVLAVCVVTNEVDIQRALDLKRNTLMTALGVFEDGKGKTLLFSQCHIRHRS